MLIHLITGQTLLTGLSAWTSIIRHSLNILKKLVSQVVTSLIKTHKIKKELKALNEFALFFIVDPKISTVRRLKVF